MIDAMLESDNAYFESVVSSVKPSSQAMASEPSPSGAGVPAATIESNAACTWTERFVTADSIGTFGRLLDGVRPYRWRVLTGPVKVSARGASTPSGSSENDRNEEVLAELRQFSSRVLTLARECVFEFGFENELDSFLRQSIARNAMATKEWLNDLFLQHFREVTIAVGILRAVAHLDYDMVYPAGPTMAIAALSHDDVEVRECGIRAFENWESLDGLKALESVRCEEPWLRDYLERVITDLRARQKDVAVCTKD